MRTRFTLGTLALVALTGLAAPRSASACATCGAGDPTLTQVGVELPYRGRVRVSLVGQRSSYVERQGAARLAAVDHRLVAGLAVSPAAFLTVSLFAPLVHRNVEYATLARDETFGIGDLDLRARFVVFRDRVVTPSHLLSLQAGLTIPTFTPLSDDRGVLLPLDAQPGTGSFTPLAGLSYSFFAEPWSMHARATIEVPTEGLGGWRAGPSVRTTLIGQWQGLAPFALGLAADTRIDTRGGAEHGEGYVVFVSPSVSVSPVDDLLVWATVRVPVVSSFDTERAEDVVVEVGVAVDVS
jgi:hypothetical protein